MADWNPSESKAFNPAAAAAALASEQSETFGRKLHFSEQCAVLAALRSHIKPAVVSLAFGVSKITISQIGGALDSPNQDLDLRHLDPDYRRENPDRPPDRMPFRERKPERVKRYRAVAREYESMSESSFIQKYYTENVHARLTQAKLDLAHGRAPYARLGPNQRADQYAFETIGAFEVQREGFWLVRWTPTPGNSGWIFAACESDGSPLAPETKHNWKGREALNGPARPFRTSKQAWQAAWRYCNQNPPRRL